MNRYFVLVLFSCMLASLAQGQATQTPPRSNAVSPQKSIDLLNLIDTAHDVVQGNWLRENGSIICKSAGREDRLRIPVHLDGTYQLDLTLKRTVRTGDTAIFVELPVGKTTVSLWLDFWGGRSSGLGKINGKGHEKNATRVVGPQLEDGRSSDISIQVRMQDQAAEVSVVLNGKNVVTWKGPQTALSADIKNVDDGLYVGVVLNSITISKFSLTAVNDAFRLLRQPPTAIPAANSTTSSPPASASAQSNTKPTTPVSSTGPTTESTEAAVTQTEINELREAKLHPIREEIKKIQALVSMLPKNRTEPTATERKLASLKTKEAAILAMSGDSLSQEIADLKAKAHAAEEANRMAAAQQELLRQQEAQARQAELDQARQARAALLARLYPNWNGPWKACPICHGSGRDADKERAINTRNASIIASQNIGQGVVRRIKGAVVPCDFCGGSGVVPDQR